METKRKLELDVVRCGMNYMIVLLHAWAAFQYVAWFNAEFIFWRLVCSHLCGLVMPAFFLISGFLLFQNFSLSQWPSKVVRRMKRLVVPYVAWNVVFVVFYLGVSRFVPRLESRVAMFGLDSWHGALSKVLSLTVPPIDGPLWFLRVLFLFVLLSPLLWFGMRFGRGLFLLGACCVWCFMEPLLGLTKLLSMTAPAYALVCFVVGGLLAEERKDIIAYFRHVGWLVVSLLACIVCAFISIAQLHGSVQETRILTMVTMVLRVLEASAMLCLASRLPVERMSRTRVYLYLREMSFFAYAGHFLFCSMWLHIIAPVLGGHWTGKFTVLVLVFVGCGVPTMAVVYGIAKRLCPRVLKLFDGTL